MWLLACKDKALSTPSVTGVQCGPYVVLIVEGQMV